MHRTSPIKPGIEDRRAEAPNLGECENRVQTSLMWVIEKSLSSTRVGEETWPCGLCCAVLTKHDMCTTCAPLSIDRIFELIEHAHLHVRRWNTFLVLLPRTSSFACVTTLAAFRHEAFHMDAGQQNRTRRALISFAPHRTGSAINVCIIIMIEQGAAQKPTCSVSYPASSQVCRGPIPIRSEGHERSGGSDYEAIEE